MKSRTLSRTATLDRQSSASFGPESETRVSRLSPDNEAVEDHNTSGIACNEGALTETANVGSSALRVTQKNEDSAGDELEPGAYTIGNGSQGRRSVGFDQDGRHRAGTNGDGAVVLRTVRIDCYKMAVDKNLWVTKLGRAKAEVVRLEAHVVLLNSCNDRLECDLNELKVTV